MSDRIEMEEYNEKIKRTNIIQWTVVGVYIALTFVMGFAPLVLPLNVIGFVIAYNVMIFGGMIIIFFILLYPFVKKPQMPEAQDGKLLEEILDTEDLPLVYYEKIRVFLAYELMIPTIIFMAALGGYYLYVDLLWTGIMCGAFAPVFILLLLFFGHLEVTANNEHLHFHYGPIGKKVPYSEIKSIRSTAVHALRDFKGWGLRAGPDGTWGYIARGKVGVRVDLKKGRTYVLTVRDPETLVRYVRAKRKGAGKKK